MHKHQQRRGAACGEATATTYYAPASVSTGVLDSVRRNLFSYGALSYRGHHLNARQLRLLAARVLELADDDVPTAAAELSHWLAERGVVLHGELLGTMLPTPARQRRLERLVEAVRRATR